MFMATHSSSARSWAAKSLLETIILRSDFIIFFIRLIHLAYISWEINTLVLGYNVYGQTFSIRKILGSQDSVTYPFCLWQHTLFQMIGVTTPSMGSTVYDLIFSFFEILGNPDSVTGPFRHTFSIPETILHNWAIMFMATHTPSARSWAVKTV
ncbi:hypothetical protein BgiMline_024343 [Biomphalaria glabrata]|nr:hypothetical protein BgiMline_007548 [Biomphalaria glabrata]